MEYQHEPVLLEEVIDLLHPTEGKNFIDLTVGGGGHAHAILSKSGPSGIVYGFDADSNAIAASQEKLKKFGKRVILFHQNFSELEKMRELYPIQEKIDGILLDLGISSFELADANRGFSFQKSAPLDMRFDIRKGLTAADILNTWPKKELTDILRNYGEEWFADPIARAIVTYRKQRDFATCDQLVSVISGAYRGKPKPKRIHFATKVFQALRMAVNNEVDNLNAVLPMCVDILAPGGRLAIISFHGVEDRIVKDFFRKESKDCICPIEFPVCACLHKKRLKIITKKAIRPSDDEVFGNRRARSAHLRMAEKLPLVK